MAFDSLHAFWTMNGHGPYVWTCYGAFLLAMVALVVWSRAQRRRVISQQRWQQRLAKRRSEPTSLTGA